MLFDGYWRKLTGKQLNLLILTVASIAISYEGLSQGVIGAAQNAPEYGHRMGFLNDQGVVTRPTLQGGIVALYYAGSLVGAFFAGWTADRYGRVIGLLCGSALCMAGTILQTSAVNLAHMFVARLIAGMGVAYIIVIAPAWTAELSPASHRGKTIALTFLANFSGIALASWVGFATSFTEALGGQFRWRFEFAIQAIPVVLLVIGVLLLPESPRWLVKMDRKEEAAEIVAKIRGGDDHKHPEVMHELAEIFKVVDEEKRNGSLNFVQMFFGLGAKDIHLGRRIQLAFWLQVLMQFGTGIPAVVVYSGSIFRTAGFGDIKSNWLSALANTVGILGTLVAAYTIDIVGRRRTLFWGAVALSIILYIIGGLQRGAVDNPAQKAQYGTAGASFVFIYIFFFSSTWLLIPFIYPTEIFPTWLRAKGNSFGVAGWAIGYGMGGLVVPKMFASINEKTFYVFASLMLIYIPIIYVFFPETAKRSLETISYLFIPDSSFTWVAEREYKARTEELEKTLNNPAVAANILSEADHDSSEDFSGKPAQTHLEAV